MTKRPEESSKRSSLEWWLDTVEATLLLASGVVGTDVGFILYGLALIRLVARIK